MQANDRPRPGPFLDPGDVRKAQLAAASGDSASGRKVRKLCVRFRLALAAAANVQFGGPRRGIESKCGWQLWAGPAGSRY